MAKTPILGTYTLHGGTPPGSHRQHWQIMVRERQTGDALTTPVGLGPLAFEPAVCVQQMGTYAVDAVPESASPGIPVRMVSGGLLSQHLADSTLLANILAAGGWADDDEMLLDLLPALTACVRARRNPNITLQVNARNEIEVIGRAPPNRSSPQARRPVGSVWL